MRARQDYDLKNHDLLYPGTDDERGMYMAKARIRLQNVSKYYYSETSITQALRKIDLRFEMNEFVAITGESGSGKSTLLKIISGMDGFDEGEFFIDEQPTSQYDDDDWERYRREKIGYIFQDYSLIGHYSARDNIISALLIMGLERQEAIRKADHYLYRVGLAGLEEQKASKLSSGQKQRLSIARALSKGTDIIVADEPTGNLDSETGEQIVHLLKELSRDHLVIMVTHNYEQVEPYATRKIRLHDGELVMDVRNQVQGEETVEKPKGFSREVSADCNSMFLEMDSGAMSDLPVKVDRKRMSDLSEKQDRNRFYMHRVALFLAGLNLRTQKGKTILFLVFFLMTATISFLFIGELLMYADDRISMEYDASSFPEENKTRLVAKRQDGKAMTQQDLDTVRAMRHVVSVDQYDNVDDINYYYRENKDYKFQYGFDDEDGNSTGSPEFLDDSHFMRSSTCIDQGDLLAGNLPERRGDVVLYSKDGVAAIGREFPCYLKHKAAWGTDDYIKWNLTVVGVLRNPVDQLYFSPALCQMLTAGMHAGNYTMYFYFDLLENRLLGKDDFIPIIGENLNENEMQVSGGYQTPLDGLGKLPRTPQEAFGGSKDYLEITRYDGEGKLQGEPIVLSAEQVGTEEFHESSGAFLAMSEKAFEEYNDGNSHQISVYISSYAKTSEVIRKLQQANYDAISTYQTSVADYDQEQVEERLTLMAIAFIVLLITLLAEMLILRSLLKLRIKDYFVMKFMGMQMKLMHRINYYEMSCQLLAAMMITWGGMLLVGRKVALIREMLYFYELPGCLCFVAYNLLAGILTLTAFHRLLEGRMDE